GRSGQSKAQVQLLAGKVSDAAVAGQRAQAGEADVACAQRLRHVPRQLDPSVDGHARRAAFVFGAREIHVKARVIHHGANGSDRLAGWQNSGARARAGAWRMTDVLILQHPQEQDVELGTVPIMLASLPNATKVVGLSWPSLS